MTSSPSKCQSRIFTSLPTTEARYTSRSPEKLCLHMLRIRRVLKRRSIILVIWFSNCLLCDQALTWAKVCLSIITFSFPMLTCSRGFNQRALAGVMMLEKPVNGNRTKKKQEQHQETLLGTGKYQRYSGGEPTAERLPVPQAIREEWKFLNTLQVLN